MKRIKEKLSIYLSDEKRLKRIDLSILIVSSVSFILILAKYIFEKILNCSYPIDINWVAFFMMLSLIFLFGLKMFVDKKTQIAFQLILLVFLMLILALALGFIKHFIFLKNFFR